MSTYGFFNFLGNLFASKKSSSVISATPKRKRSSTPAPKTSPRPKGRNIPKGGWLDAVEESKSGGALHVYDPAGSILKLGAKDEKGSGGEGTVYELPMNGRFLIKIYKDETLKDPRKTAELQKRIISMVNIPQCTKMPFLAWPVMPAMNARKEIIGFVMRKCTGHSFLTLRGPRFINQRFPGWTRRELALTALDFVKKVRLLAANNILINDFNPANFLVNDKCEVTFIDCDSYQVPDGKGGVNITRTYFPSHVAPELLLNMRFLDEPRNIHQVKFGTALTAFNILMCGMHPYNYCDPSNTFACGTPEENLKKGLCPLGVGTGCMLPQGIWYNLWSWLTFKLKDYFIRMFKDGHSTPGIRPSLEELQKHLEELLFCMQKDPERANLVPVKAKSAERKSPSGGFTSGARRPFGIHGF